MGDLISTALCTREDIKDWGELKGYDNKSDNLLNDLINRITTQFVSFCGRNFLQASYTEYLNGNGGNYLFPSNTPIQSVTSIYDDTGWTWGSDTLISSSDYKIIDSNCIYYLGTFSRREGSVKLTYSGGYTSIPHDLKQACVMEVRRLYQRRSDIDVQSRTDSNTTKTYITDAFLKQTLTILNKYKVRLIL